MKLVRVVVSLLLSALPLCAQDRSATPVIAEASEASRMPDPQPWHLLPINQVSYLSLGIAITAGLAALIYLLRAHRRGRAERFLKKRYLATIEDLSTRLEETESDMKELQERETKLRIALEIMNDGMLVLDKEMNVQNFNSRFIEMMETSTRTMEIGRPWLETLRSNARAGHYGEGEVEEMAHKRLELYLNPGLKEFEIDLPSGRTVIGRKNTIPSIGVVATFSDITEKVEQTQRLNEAKERAESASMAKSQFLASMSHEIRTPLNAIIGYSQLMSNDPATPIEQKENLGTINQSGRHLLGLINDVLDMSAIEAGRLVLVEDHFDLRELIEECAAMFALLAKEKGLLYSVVIDNSVPAALYGDRNKIKQVIINLIGNALKFTEKGGIGISVTTSASPKGAILGVSVKDTGAGVPQAEVENIFKVFEQTKVGVVAGGTGLGLPISRSLARAMGGDVTVEPRAKLGSLFVATFDLQISGQTYVAQAPIRRAIGLAEGQKTFPILVVDGDGPSRHLLRDVLTPFGFDVATAETASKAVAAFEALAPGAVFLDGDMPERDGVESIKRMRALPAGKDAAIIVLTTSNQIKNLDEAKRIGADSILRKPVMLEEIFGALAEFADCAFIYEDLLDVEDQVPEFEFSGQVDLPEDLCSAIISALEEGNIKEIRELLDSVKKFDMGFGVYLLKLVNKYDFERVSQLLQNSDESGGPCSG